MMPMVFWASFPPWPRENAAAEPSCSTRNTLSTRRGSARRNSQESATVKLSEKIRPSSGARKMKVIVPTHLPGNTRAAKPAFEIAAPASPPTRAWDEDDGMPPYQVIKSQAIAPINVASMTLESTMLGSTMPFAMVLATAVVKMNAATKLKNAAQTTAKLGESTRVDTTVAIEFAASWNPLTKSNASATRTIARTNQTESASGVLDGDGLKHVGDVFALVEGHFEIVVDLLPLDDLEGVALGLEHVAEGFLVDRVTLFFELFRLDAVLHHVVALLEAADGFGEHAHHPLDHLGELLHALRCKTQVENLGAASGAVDRVHHIVQIGRELEDVLAIERRDEGAIEPVHYLMRDLVGLVLQSLDRLDVGDAALGGRVEQLAQMLRRDRAARGDRYEQVEELFFPGQEAHGRPHVIGGTESENIAAPRRSH